MDLCVVGSELHDQHRYLLGYPLSKIFEKSVGKTDGKREDACPLHWKRLKKSTGMLEIAKRFAHDCPLLCH
ncbi:unnamed protein product [Ilex paraguariensis]|uniref:Uncharacterized protein n=1 Tax=Ilex paraguariensis TaxID=185542 RepID=A0ABC8R5H4_9AQUA